MNVPLVTPESGLVLEDTMMTPTRVVITQAAVEIMEDRTSKQWDISLALELTFTLC